MIDALAHGLNHDPRQLVIGILALCAGFFGLGFMVGILFSKRFL